MVDYTSASPKRPGETEDPAQEAWEKVPFSPHPDVIQRLIYDYLVYNCFSDSAKSFGSACQMIEADSLGKLLPRSPSKNRRGEVTAMDIDDDGAVIDMNGLKSSAGIGGMGGSPGPSLSGPLQTLEFRKQLCKLITTGHIKEAIEYCNETFPNALAGSSPQVIDICFQLNCQQFIEYVRTSAPDAMAFAQHGAQFGSSSLVYTPLTYSVEFGKFSAYGEKYMAQLQDIIALIAYAHPEESPLASYMSQQRREDVALQLNSHILGNFLCFG